MSYAVLEILEFLIVFWDKIEICCDLLTLLG